MVAMNLAGNFFFRCGIERVADGAIQFREKTFRRPAMFQKKIFQPRLFAALAKNFTGAENFRYSSRHVHHLIPPHESIEFARDVRLSGKPAANAHGKSVFNNSAAISASGSECHIVYFRVAAPGAAAGDRHLKFSRQVVEFAIAAECAIDRQRKWRSVKVFVSGKTRDRAPGHIADHIAACAGGGQSGSLQLLD